jgi:hypothetical protein
MGRSVNTPLVPGVVCADACPVKRAYALAQVVQGFAAAGQAVLLDCREPFVADLAKGGSDRGEIHDSASDGAEDAGCDRWPESEFTSLYTPQDCTVNVLEVDMRQARRERGECLLGTYVGVYSVARVEAERQVAVGE